jgi:hypothetical protein
MDKYTTMSMSGIERSLKNSLIFGLMFLDLSTTASDLKNDRVIPALIPSTSSLL